MHHESQRTKVINEYRHWLRRGYRARTFVRVELEYIADLVIIPPFPTRPRTLLSRIIPRRRVVPIRSFSEMGISFLF
jgi:hypothetical protein